MIRELANAAFVGDAAGAGSALGRLTTLFAGASASLRSLPVGGAPTGNTLPVVNEVVSILMVIPIRFTFLVADSLKTSRI